MSETGFWRFLRSFGTDWLSAMSGGLSVPLTVAAVFIPGTAYKIGLATLAVIAFMGSSYRVWRNERRRAVEAERRLTAGAEAQAELAKAQHDLLKRAEDEEQGHQRWVGGVLTQLRTPGAELVHVVPGDLLHAQWVLARGYVEGRSTSRGLALVLPLAERCQIPGSPEAKMLEARRTILTTCAEHPGTWSTWERNDGVAAARRGAF